MSEPLLHLQKSHILSGKQIVITGSKSESNRVLLLKAIYPQIDVENLSNSDDTALMQSALKSSQAFVDIHHAGTAMRFLTAYFAILEGSVCTLTGSERMKERPISVLVEALKSMGANISYLENEGYPPLKIEGLNTLKSKVALKANVSSQYISALLLIGSSLKHGLELHLKGKITSKPYIDMTLSLLREIGIESSFEGHVIKVKRTELSSIAKTQIIVESDWSSASYFYSIVALSEVGSEVYLSHFKSQSLQGDSSLITIYENFGVETDFKHSKLRLRKVRKSRDSDMLIDLSNSPDLAQTIAVTAFGLGIKCSLTGLHTLKIKETDRLEALKIELTKVGANINITNDSLSIDVDGTFIPNQNICTYNDHRMAMAFAPLALLGPLSIEDPSVVSKSYPDFWKDLKRIGFVMK